MVISYDFRKYLDKYYLKNTITYVSPLKWTLEIKDIKADAFILITSGVVAVGVEVEIPIVRDGFYRLALARDPYNNGIEVLPPESGEVIIRHYLRLQKEVIANTVNILCNNDCGCIDCISEGSECAIQQALFNQLLAYQFIAKPYDKNYLNSNALFERFLQEALNQNKAYLSDRVYDDITRQLSTGKVESNSETLGIFASIYLCSFYFYEKMLAHDDAERLFVSQKFNWPKVSNCMKRYIPFSNLEEIFIEISDLCPPTSIFLTRADFDYLWAAIQRNTLAIAELRGFITIIDGQLQLKVSKEEFDALGRRVTIAETSITQNANEIALRATKIEFNALGNRVSQAESSIIQNANQIALKVSQQDFNALGVRVGLAESSIIQNANQIALKVSQTQFDALGVRVGLAESSIIQNANQIALRVTQSVFDALGNRVTTAESSIIQNANQIALKVSQTDFNALGVRVSNAESSITQNAAQIALRVTQTTFDALGNRVTTAESSIIQNATQIALRVTQTNFDTLTGRVSTAESSIVQNAAQIALKVSSTDFTGEKLVSLINIEPSSIKIQSKNIQFDGSVLFSYLDSPTITINKTDPVTGIPDRAFKLYHSNGVVGILMDTNPSTGLANIAAYNSAGVKTWDLNSVTGLVYVTVIPESWVERRMTKIPIDDVTPITDQAKADIRLWIRTGGGCDPGEGVLGIKSNLTSYNYYAGTNSESGSNTQFVGAHKTQDKLTTNFIDDGWYMYPGYWGTDVEGGTVYTVTVLRFVAGKQVDGANITGVTKRIGSGTTCPSPL